MYLLCVFVCVLRFESIVLMEILDCIFFFFFFITGDTTFYEIRNIDCLNIFDLITVIYRISVIDTRKIVKGIVEFIFYLVS